MDIRKADRTALKSYFVKNAIPTESNFAELIDAGLNQKDDGIAKLPGEPLSLQGEGADTSLKKALNFFKSFADQKPAWTLNLNPRVTLGNPQTARPGWSIGDGDGNSRLFIDQGTGHVGLGTVEPGVYRLQIAGPAFVNGAQLHVVAENAGRLRVGAAWGMPGIYSSDDGPKPLVLGVAAGQKVYLGVASNDAWVEGGTGHAYFRGNVTTGGTLATGGNLTVGGNVGIGIPAPAESLDIRGRLRAAVLSVGPWPANGSYGFVGVNTLDQANPINYALLQGSTDGPGRTYLNSPVDIRFRINNGDQMILAKDGSVGIGHMSPAGKLHVHTGGAGAWDKFVVNTTKHWGDNDNQYVTIGEGGASGIMLYNPHVVWYAPESRASIRLGRSGGVATGHYWDVGVRGGNEFSILNPQTGIALSILQDGLVRVNAVQLGTKFRLSGVGDGLGNDEWLRQTEASGKNYGGGFAAGKLWTLTGALTGSDVRLKKDITVLEDATASLLKLRAVRFRRRDDADDAACIGLVAQEVESVFPEAVSEGPEGMKGIDYALLVAPLIDVVQRHQAQIEVLRAEMQALGAR